MELSDQELKDSWVWFFGAGIAAICLCVFLYSVDEYRSNSNAEHELAETLRTIRTAQFVVAGNELGVDSRMTGLYSAPLNPSVKTGVHEEAHH